MIKSGPNSVSANEFLDLPSNDSLILEASRIENLKKGKSWTFSPGEEKCGKNILLEKTSDVKSNLHLDDSKN